MLISERGSGKLIQAVLLTNRRGAAIFLRHGLDRSILESSVSLQACAALARFVSSTGRGVAKA